MPGKQRAILLLLAVVAAVVAIIVVPSLGDDEELPDETAAIETQTQAPATTGSSSTTPQKPKPTPPVAKTVTVRAGKPVGGVKRLSYENGQTVNVVITSDTADEVHVHGYDITKNLPAGGRARLRFRANREGIYEIELHHSGEQIAQLRVNPG